MRKYLAHVEIDRQWPEDTTPDEYLASLRDTVLDPQSGIYMTDANTVQEWAVYFVGRVRRPWRGDNSSDRVVVIFNGERAAWARGFNLMMVTTTSIGKAASGCTDDDD